MRYVAILILILLSARASFAQQNRADLERRRQSILASIRESQAQLEETKKNKNATLSQLRALQAKLDARLRLISNINDEMEAINGSIQTSTQEVGHLRSNLEVLKMRYAQSIRYAYASRSASGMLAFLCSSADYNDALRRLKYLKRYRDYRQQQAEEIRNTQDRIVTKIGALNNEKSQKDQLLAAQEQQRKVLQQEAAETNHVVMELKSREKQLLTDIEKNRQAAKKVERAVAAIIQREIDEQRRRAQEEARRASIAAEARRRAAELQRSQNGGGGITVTSGGAPTGGARNPSTTTSSSSGSSVTSNINTPRSGRVASAAVDLSMTPEAQALSNSFAANRGKLPWPVERGTITGHFGPHKHPVANVIVDRNGIDIQTASGATARAVFDGTVTSVFPVPGSGVNVVIVHGGFFTVYGNLSNASVSKGQQVHTKQTIGTVGNNDEGLPTLDFQIWKVAGKSSAKLNPEQWIAR